MRLKSAAFALAMAVLSAASFAQQKVLTGQDAFTDYTKEHPGVRRHLTVADLPAPNEESSVNNGAQMVPRPEGAWPQAPAGFKVTLYAEGFNEPRLIRTAPNGDLFLADSRGGQVVVLRGVGSDGKPQVKEAEKVLVAVGRGPRTADAGTA